MTADHPLSSFVENKHGVLIHRPRSVTVYNVHRNMHIAVGNYCGINFHGPDGLTLIDAPQESGIVCHRCEALAIAAGLPSSSMLAGRHVHIGGVKAYKLCCP